MARLSRKIAILAKIETPYGTDATPTGAANAILISNQNINPLNAQNVERNNVRSYFGASGQLIGSAYVEVSFDVEIAGSGAAGTPPAWGVLFRGCSFAETVTASVRTEYTPVTDSPESLTIYYYDDGALHKLLGARGTVSIKLGAGDRPVFSFRFLGLDGGITAVANPSQTLTAFQTPLAVTDANTGDFTLGCTYTAATPALTGGTTYTSKGLEFDIGNDVQHIPLIGGESVEVTGRKGSGKFMLDLTAANEVTFMGDVKTNTTQSLGLVHGTTGGNKVLVYAPQVRLFNPRKEDVNGRRLIGFDASFEPATGNDEIRIVAA